MPFFMVGAADEDAKGMPAKYWSAQSWSDA
jgi:hypothetical protein